MSSGSIERISTDVSTCSKRNKEVKDGKDMRRNSARIVREAVYAKGNLDMIIRKAVQAC